MQKKVITSGEAPSAIGPYSQAIKASGLIFVSGQIPLDQLTGNVVEGGIERQTERVMKNIEAILISASSGLDKVVKTTIYLKDLKDFNAVNEVYSDYFKSNPPARATVEVSNLPRNVSIEIDAIAIAD